MRVFHSLWSEVGASLLGVALCTLLSALYIPAHAQEAKKIARIGVLSPASGPSTPVLETLRQGLRDLGYFDGKNITIEYRFSSGKSEQFPILAQELVREKVDVIVTDGGAASRAAKQATSVIPIVMASVGDPVAIGLVASLAQPGSNVTGFSLLSASLTGKRLEILREAFHKVSQIAVFWDSTTPGHKTVALKETEIAARALGVQVHPTEVQSPADFEKSFEALNWIRPGALMTLSSAMFWNHRRQIVKLVGKSRLPAMFPEKEFADEGGLMTYGPNVPDNFRRAATYVDKILKGAKPADLPIEQPTKFEFVINLRTAKQIGLTIPPNILARADRVIK